MTTPVGPSVPDERGTGATVPTCFRHPGRETYVRCTRCERPICPDCMTSASVGFQCPECIAEGARTLRAPRTVAGGRMAAAEGRVTLTIAALIGVAFVLQLAVPGFEERFTEFNYAIAQGEWWRLVTAMFLHVGLLHLAFNLYVLYLVGIPVERALGRWRYIALYLLSGLGGAAASYALTGPGAAGEGASGAIFGLFAAWWVTTRRAGGDTKSVTMLIALNLVLSFVLPNIGYWAHLGGLATGAVLALTFAYAPRARRTPAALGMLVLVSAAILATVVLRTAALTA